jgi:hypothetical protein
MLERDEVEIIGNLRIEYTAFYEVDADVEECHGFHTMTDVDEVGRNINKIYICIEDYELDITNKLTKKELSDLEDYLSNL